MTQTRILPTTTARFGAAIIALLLVFGYLQAGTSQASEVSLQDRYAAARDSAARLDAADEHVAKAVSALDKGLDPANWVDASTLSDRGKKAFESARKAIKELNKAGIGGDIVDELVDIARDMAKASMATTAALGGDMAKAEQEAAKAEAKLADGKPADAVKGFLKAWDKGTKGNAPSGGGGDGGSWAKYDVVYVRADTVTWDTPVFLHVSGNNAAGTPGFTGKGNEGFIFDYAFGPNDTFHGDSLMHNGVQGMQLHVSCSDAFPAGYGAKSDPSMESSWLINTIAISKINDGVVEKTCDITGAGLVEPPSNPGTDPGPGV